MFISFLFFFFIFLSGECLVGYYGLMMFMLVMYLFMAYSQSLQSVYVCYTFMSDPMSNWLVYISFFVLLSSLYLNSQVFDSYLTSFSLVVLLMMSVMFFTVSSFIIMYFMYELAIFPIAYIIMKWGSYSDRSFSVMMMMVYTSVFTFPMMLFMSFCYYYYGSFEVVVYSSQLYGFTSMVWLSLLPFLGFIVKLPIYGLHFWLPLAHVEAPTFGSMILAGILLKLGGYGLWRFFTLLDSRSFLVFLGYFMVVLIISSLVTASQHDFKRLIAYSSVVHMTVLLPVFLLSGLLSYSVFLMIMIFHGVLSPLMFFLSGLVYKTDNSRLLVFLGSLKMSSFYFFFIIVLVFLMSVPTPPFIQFLYEVLLFISVFLMSGFWVVVIVMFAMLSLLYNLVWFIPLTAKPFSLSTKSILEVYDYLLVLVYLLLLNFLMFFVWLM